MWQVFFLKFKRRTDVCLRWSVLAHFKAEEASTFIWLALPVCAKKCIFSTFNMYGTSGILRAYITYYYAEMIYVHLLLYISPNVSVTVGNYYLAIFSTKVCLKFRGFKLGYTCTFEHDLLYVFLADERWDN